SIWPTRLPAAIEIRPAQIALHDDELDMTNLVARSAGVQATLAGHMKIDPDDTSASRLSATADVTADGRQLAAALGRGNRLAGGGWIMVAGSQGPGRIQLAPHRSPLPIAGIDLLVRGTGLTTRHPVGGVSLKNLAFALALTPRDSRVQTLWLTGSVHLEQT